VDVSQGRLIEVCAAGEAAWQEAAYAGLRMEWRRQDGLAWGPSGAPHRFLLAAVTLTPVPALPTRLIGGMLGVIRDSWGALAPEDVPGWTPVPDGPWMIRAPAPCAVPAVAGVTVERTRDPLLFERTAFLAAGGAPPEEPGELHPADSGDVPGLHLFLARREGSPVGTALAVEHDRGVIVNGVAVLGAERRRGVGSALTATALNVAPGLPATLTASDLGQGTYRRLGFEPLGQPVNWQPPEG